MSKLANRPLTEKMKAFARHSSMLVDGTKAAILAGYSKNSASAMACKLLQDPGVKREIGKHRARRLKEWEEEVQMVKLDTLNCAKRTIHDFIDKNGNWIPLEQLPPEVAACIQGFDIVVDKQGHEHRVPIWTDKQKAQDILYKLVGLYAPEKHINANTSFDISDLYGMPQGALDDDVIEDPKLEEK